MAPADGPWSRPIGLPPGEREGGVAAAAADIPWIDPHQHTQSLTWNDREAFDLSGGRAVVMVAASYYWAPYRPVSASDVRFLWDDALRRAETFARNHCFDVRVAVGVHTWARVEGTDALLEALPAYADHDAVVAIGETGLESTQHTSAWDLEGQLEVLRGQFHVARETGLPVVLHTPGSSKGGLPAWHADRYEEEDGSFTDPVLDAGRAKAEAIERCVDLADEVGLPHEQVVVDHASPDVAAQVLEGTGCHLAFSVAAPWLRGLDAGDVAGVVREHGPERVLLDTDLAGSMANDPFAMRRFQLDLLRLGLDPGAVRRVSYENARVVFGLDA